MRLNSRRLKLFENVTDMQGIISDSLVAYSKKAWSFNTVRPREAQITYVNRYRYIVWLNLWLVVVQIEWIGREQKYRNG